MLNPVYLKTFVTLAETGHFTRTAEKLFMTQPGVTQHIQKLEQECGHKLLQRNNRKLELTEQGKLLYQYALEQVKREAELFNKLAFDDPCSGHFSIGCSGSMALKLYPTLLQLQAQFPELIPTLKAAPQQDILQGIAEGKLDMGIVTQYPPEGIFNTRDIGRESLYLMFPTAVTLGKDIAEHMKQLGLINHPDARQYLSLYCSQTQDAALNRLDIDALPVSGFINQIGQILLPVANGLGFTVLPESAWHSFSQKQRVQLYQPETVVSEPLILITKRLRKLPKRCLHVISEIERCLG